MQGKREQWSQSCTFPDSNDALAQNYIRAWDMVFKIREKDGKGSAVMRTLLYFKRSLESIRKVTSWGAWNLSSEERANINFPAFDSKL